jgi:hypothetical protein
MAGGFTLVDVSPSACYMSDQASSLEILDPAGRPLKVDVKQFPPGFESNSVILAPETPQNASDQTGVQVFWTNWCGSWSGAGTLVVAFPTIGSLRASIEKLSAPRCDAPGQASVVEVGPVTTTRQGHVTFSVAG